MPAGIAAVAGLELIRLAPRLIEEGLRIYDAVRGGPGSRAPDPAGAGAVRDLHSEVSGLQERLEALESREESQARLIAEMTRYQGALLRWLLWLALAAGAAGALALAALIVAVLR